MSHDVEILPPEFKSRREAQGLIRTAVSHFQTAKRATIQTMADLRKLQDGNVHILYGYKNFADWAEHTFDGLTAGNVRQLCRAGAVVLELDRAGLLDLSKPEGIGTTALRELSTISGTYGRDKMIEVFNTCKEIVEDTGKDISSTTVESAMRLLMPPAVFDDPVIDEPKETDELEDDDDDPENKYSTKCRELIDRIRDLAYDLPDEGDVKEMDQALEQLDKELKGAEANEDQTWIDGTR